MNSFVDAFFSIILSWVRSLSNALWTAFRSGGQQGILSWLSGHWLGLLIILIVGGLVTDWIIWMLRWRPYRLWFGGLRCHAAPWKGAADPAASPVYGQDFAEYDETEAVPAHYPADDDVMEATYVPALDEERDTVSEPWPQTDAAQSPYAPPPNWAVSTQEAAWHAQAPETADVRDPAYDAYNVNHFVAEEPYSNDDVYALEDEPEPVPQEPEVWDEPLAQEPLADDDQAQPPSDAAAPEPRYGRPGLWPGMGWMQPKVGAEKKRTRRGARWAQEIPSDGRFSDQDDLPWEEPEAEPSPIPEPEAPDTFMDSAYVEDAYQDDEVIASDSNEEGTTRRRRSSFREDMIRTVTGAPAKRRGIMRLAESEDEAISGLPPLMAREDGYHQPAMPNAQKKSN